MITNKIVSKLLPYLLKEVFKAVMPELKPLQQYVNEPNELDIKVKQMQKKIRDRRLSNYGHKRFKKFNS